MGNSIQVSHNKVLAPIVVILSVGLNLSPSAQAATVVDPGDNVAQIVETSAEGAEFIFTPGLYRLLSIAPKSDQTFIGEAGAILSGSKTLKGFIQEGEHWVIGGQDQVIDNDLPEDPANLEKMVGQFCAEEFVGEACLHREALFIDDVMLTKVDTMDKLGKGRWFFDRTAQKIYLDSSDNPQGKLVETTVLSRAFGSRAYNVTIRGFIVEKYASALNGAAIEQTGNYPVGPGWTVVDNTVRLNHGIGIRLAANGTARANRIHDNGLGISGAGANILIEGNTIENNNSAMEFSANWHAGGSKFVWTDDLILRGNWVRGNKGPGLWTDGNNWRPVFENNVVEDNLYAGIFCEISYHCIIRNNTARGNGYLVSGGSLWQGGGGIAVTASPDAQVYNNVVADNYNGLVVIANDRGEGRFGPYLVKNLLIRNNTVALEHGTTGMVSDAALTPTDNNRFEDNTYLLRSDANYFRWFVNNLDEAQWQQSGNDVSGSFVRCDETNDPPCQPQDALPTPPLPFGGTPFLLPGVLKAAHFDEGGLGVAYHDVSNWNQGNAPFRQPASVDLQTGDAGLWVTGFETDEWLHYSLQVDDPATFQPTDSRRVPRLGSCTGVYRWPALPNLIVPILPGALDAWENVFAGEIPLAAGDHSMRLQVEAGLLTSRD
ncbi:MAG: right-handed parallel beta-helix repeat-containing protein [Myxococcota bacterium]